MKYDVLTFLVSQIALAGSLTFRGQHHLSLWPLKFAPRQMVSVITANMTVLKENVPGNYSFINYHNLQLFCFRKFAVKLTNLINLTNH